MFDEIAPALSEFFASCHQRRSAAVSRWRLRPLPGVHTGCPAMQGQRCNFCLKILTCTHRLERSPAKTGEGDGDARKTRSSVQQPEQTIDGQSLSLEGTLRKFRRGPHRTSNDLPTDSRLREVAVIPSGPNGHTMLRILMIFRCVSTPDFDQVKIMLENHLLNYCLKKAFDSRQVVCKFLRAICPAFQAISA